MKKCPFCAEEIQPEAIKCRYCGEFLDKSGRPRTKGLFSTTFIVLSFMFVGPFALPLVWFHPRYKKATKITVTIIVTVLTVLACCLLAYVVPKLVEHYRQLGELTKQLRR